MTPTYERSKRALDLILTSLALILVFPLLLMLGVAVLLDSGWPVLYVHERVGRYGKPFPFYKFRTMVVNAHALGKGYEITAGDSRITRLGHFLRRWHLDELPQLFNVLRGDMSLVGPRPTLQYQVDTYTPRQWERLKVLPGLTGLAQVRGLNALTWPEKIEIDLEYVEKASLWLDLNIMLHTFSAVAAGDDVYGPGSTFSPIAQLSTPPSRPGEGPSTRSQLATSGSDREGEANDLPQADFPKVNDEQLHA